MSKTFLYTDSYGDVYKSKKDGELYLIKIIKADRLKFKNQFETLNAMKNLSLYINKNLSEYIDFYFNDDGNLEILMEYEDGSEYSEKIKYNKDNNRTFEEDYIWSLIIQLLNLLKYIQQNKDINIDIDPTKILLMNDGTLKVFDFGMELIANKDLAPTFSGNNDSIFVMPPECAKGEKGSIDKDAANIWKAGCIIYELCTLKHIFEIKSGFEMRVKLSKFEGNYEINIDDKYSSDIKTLLSKMLIAEPGKRAKVDDLLKSDIIVKRMNNNKLAEKEKLEKKLLSASIFTFKQSILKNSVKDSLRQIKNQNEMMENDNYEILKFSLAGDRGTIKESQATIKESLGGIKESLGTINENQGTVNYLKQTGFFGDSQNEKEKEKENIKKKDFRELLMGEKLRKEKEQIEQQLYENAGIFDRNDFSYNYNNPFRMDNDDNKDDRLKVINKPNNIINNNKNEITKIKIDNFIQKEREKTPLHEARNKRYFLDVDNKNTNNNIKNKSKPKYKENKSKDVLPKLYNPFAPNNVLESKDLKQNNNINININDQKKKKEEPLKLFKVKKVKKFENTNKLMNRPVNNLNNKQLMSMTNAQIDAVLNNILHKQNVNLANKIQKKTNIINNNMNNININNNKNLIDLNKPSDNKMKLKPLPKALKNLPNNNTNKGISYGTVEYKSKKGKKPKLFVKK